MGHKLLARPAVPSPVITTDISRSTTRLPTEMLSDQVRRLVVFSTVAFVLWTFALMVEAVILPVLWTGHRNWSAVSIEIFGSIGSGIMCYLMRRSRLDDQRKNDLGPVMMLIHAVGIAVFNATAYPPMGDELLRVSWIALLILIYSMIAPTSPRPAIPWALHESATAMEAAAVTPASTSPIGSGTRS